MAVVARFRRGAASQNLLHRGKQKFSVAVAVGGDNMMHTIAYGFSSRADGLKLLRKDAAPGTTYPARSVRQTQTATKLRRQLRAVKAGA